ncbi:MAG: hypothetical protein HY540_04755 [Deltaproteobacteria bacterium]|nr:hypothetical protein [Deltaproteobacteria bacterium]
MSGIGIVLNPHSRANRKDPGRARRFGFIVGDKGSCYETQTLADVERLAKEFRDRGIEILGISGGDGTLHKTLSVFVKVYGDRPLPRIAFLRGGTMNNVATTLGIHGTSDEILSRLILKYHRGDDFPTTQVPLLRVNHEYGFLFGLGMPTRFLQTYGRYGEESQTPYRAAALVAGYTLSALMNGKAAARMCRRFDAHLTVDGEVLPFKNYILIFGGTIECACFNFRPLYRTRQFEGRFQILGLSCTPRHLALMIPQILMAKPIASDCMLDRVGSSVVIECSEPLRYMIDGDISEEVQRIELGLGPKLECVIP